MVSPSRSAGTSNLNVPARSVGVVPTITRRLPRSAAIALYERELAFYRADEPYLPVEKCAQRCQQLSALLAMAHTNHRAA